MVKIYSPAFATAIANPVNAIANCCLITRRDGEKFGGTDWDRPIVIPGGWICYPDGGFNPSDTDSDLSFQPKQISLESYYAGITEADLASGQFDFAKVRVIRVDPYNLPSSLTATPLEYDPVLNGSFGKLTLRHRSYLAETQSLIKLLATKTGWSMQKGCRNGFCDDLCTLNISTFTDTRSVASTGNPQSFESSASFPLSYYLGGKLVWLTGGNAGRETTIVYSSGTNLRLLDRMPEAIAIGDTFTVERACDKSRYTCEHEFNNSQNFNGEHDIPQSDSYLSNGATDG
jgi:uncharacterized phage protein (TIGR02218 family)